MDVSFELNGESFIWDARKAEANARKHGIRFEEAAWVFFDPLLVVVDATRNNEARQAVIGFGAIGRLLCVVHLEIESEAIRLTPPGGRSPAKRRIVLSERLKTRLNKDRPMISITLRIPADVVESLKTIAPLRGFSGYQTLLKSYISEGLRRDEAQYATGTTARLIEALKKRGVPESVLEEAARDLDAA